MSVPKRAIVIRPGSKAFDTVIEDILGSLDLTPGEVLVETPAFGGAYQSTWDALTTITTHMKQHAAARMVVLIAFTSTLSECNNGEQVRTNMGTLRRSFEYRAQVMNEDITVYAFEVKDLNEVEEPELTWSPVDMGVTS